MSYNDMSENQQKLKNPTFPNASCNWIQLAPEKIK